MAKYIESETLITALEKEFSDLAESVCFDEFVKNLPAADVPNEYKAERDELKQQICKLNETIGVRDTEVYDLIGQVERHEETINNMDKEAAYLQGKIDAYETYITKVGVNNYETN